jgi:hypothetical protein
MSGESRAQFGTRTTTLLIAQSVFSNESLDFLELQRYKLSRPNRPIVHIEAVMTAPGLAEMELVVRDLVASQPLHQNRRRMPHDPADVSVIRAHISACVQNDPVALLFQVTNLLYDSWHGTHVSVGLPVPASIGQRSIDIDDDYFFMGEHGFIQAQCDQQRVALSTSRNLPELFQLVA